MPKLSKEIRVLVVDDAYFMRDLISKELKEYGCEVLGEARNGEEAIAMYKELKPNLITMDIDMPKVNGIEAIKEIKKIDPSVNIIVISGKYDLEEKSIQVGAIDFLRKPFQPAFLWQKIDKLVMNGICEVNEKTPHKNTDRHREAKPSIAINLSEEDDLLGTTLMEDVADVAGDDEKSTHKSVKDSQCKKFKPNNKPEPEFEIGSSYKEEEFEIDSFIQEKEFTINNSSVDKRVPEEFKIKTDDQQEDAEEPVIAISIRPPREHFNIGLDEKYIQNNKIEAPILNYVEDEREEPSPESFSEKILGKFMELKNKILKLD